MVTLITKDGLVVQLFADDLKTYIKNTMLNYNEFCVIGGPIVKRFDDPVIQYKGNLIDVKNNPAIRKVDEFYIHKNYKGDK